MKEKILFSVLSIILIVYGMFLGTFLMIKYQKPTTVINSNGEGLTTISIDYLGQNWNYELDKTGVQSIND